MQNKLFVLLLVLLVGCTYNSAPKPPTPPPPHVAVCGDGICEVGEMCAKDCEAPPPPPPVTPCGKIKSRWLTFGYYSMFAASDPSKMPNYDGFAEDVCQSLFTGVSVHLLSPWDKLPGGTPAVDDWPFTFRNGRFDVTKINPFWVAKLNRFLDAFGKHGLDVEISFLDQYCCTPGLNKYLPQQYHPFRQNNIGVNWNDNADALYSSLTFAPTVFNHIEWKDVDEHKLKWDFSVKTPAAKMMDLYIDAVVTAVAQNMAEWPQMRVAWKWANETQGGDTIGDSLGDRSEMVAYVAEKFAKAGLKPSKRFFSFVDRDYHSDIYANEKFGQIDQQLSITRAYGVSDGLGAIHEIHGMCNTTFINARLVLCGTAHGQNGCAADRTHTLFSNDGNKCSVEYPKGPREIIAMDLPFTDIKMEESWTTRPKYLPGHINDMWKRYAKVHLQLAE